MSWEKKIKNAYDGVHAPDALTERLRQELYQQALRHEEDVVGGIAEEVPKPDPIRMLKRWSAFIAATVMLCGGLGLAVWYAHDKAVGFHPGANVSAPETIVVPDVQGLSVHEAQLTLVQLGLNVEYSGGEGVVFGTEPAAGTQLARGSAVRLIVTVE